jgi:hypothetical protein
MNKDELDYKMSMRYLSLFVKELEEILSVQNYGTPIHVLLYPQNTAVCNQSVRGILGEKK